MENYEQKYKEALDRCKRKYEFAKNEGANGTMVWMEEIFPELKESEDERIRKELISFVRGMLACHDKPNAERDEKYESWIAWLEKQGEQSHCNGEVNDEALQRQLQIWFDKGKCSGRDEVIFHPENFGLQKQGKQKPQGKPALEVWKDMRLEVYQQASGNRHELNYSDDSTKMFSLTDIDEIFEKVAEKQGEQNPANKVEPKFKVGDWVVYNRNDSSREIIQVYDIRDGRYYFTDNVHFSWSIKECDEKAHLWTIQDAKDGDVLYSPCLKLLWIFKSRATLYCGCNLNYNDGAFCGVGYFERPTDAIPATKEQRDFLFKKMKEAGYEWSDKDRKLIKMK